MEGGKAEVINTREPKSHFFVNKCINALLMPNLESCLGPDAILHFILE